MRGRLGPQALPSAPPGSRLEEPVRMAQADTTKVVNPHGTSRRSLRDSSGVAVAIIAVMIVVSSSAVDAQGHHPPAD